MINAIGQHKDTSKPYDPNAYLDKALLLHDSHVWHFHRALHNEKSPRTLEKLVEEAEDIGKKLSESEDDEYRNNMV
uniref:DUF5664 domain-containing protein n=1 Tax=Steinernema glaseri TaxID=37863 RepID=A0A1I7Y5D3_9BILA